MSLIIQPITISNTFECVCNDIGLTTTTKYMPIGYIDNASTDPKEWVLSKNIEVLSMLYDCRVAHTAAGAETVIFSLMKNGNPVSMALIINPTETTGNTIGQTSELFSAGDTIGIEVDKSGVILSSPIDVSISILYK
jgi:hypothetical protein